MASTPLPPEPGRRRSVVGVLGSGVESDPRAEAVGQLVAELGCDLLTGGGGGVMAAASRGFVATPGRRGRVIGILPGAVPRMDELARRDLVPGRDPVGWVPPPGYPNPWVEIAIRTHLPDRGNRGTSPESRNHINVLSSDVVVALPGGDGTRAEVWLAVAYGVPCVVVGDHAGLPNDVRHAADVPALRRHLTDILHLSI